MRGKHSLRAVVAVTMGWVCLSGCAEEDPVDLGTPDETSEPPPVVTEDETPEYFADAAHVGEEVTITAGVETDLTDESVVLDAADYGDESLLVLFRSERKEFGVGSTVTVTGTVERFSYDTYADQYGLAESALFEVYADEEFLAAEEITTER